MIPAPPTEVAGVFERYPQNVRVKLMGLRALILNTAATIGEVGELTETLKWGQAAYLTQSTKSGTTIRLAWSPKTPNHYRLYVHCQTSLIETFRTLFPDDLRFEGNRAIVFEASEKIETSVVVAFIEAALTYHLQR